MSSIDRQESVYVVMPAYNEEENIESVVEAWYPVVEGCGANSRLVVADSGSVDATHEILVKLKEKYPKLEILTDSDKQHGPKVIALYKYAIRNHADYVFQTDSDGQTNPVEFDGFWQVRHQYDAIIGKRIVRGDGASRKFVEMVLCGILFTIFGVKVPDANAPFRLMKTELVNRYIGRMADDYNLPNAMMTTFFAFYGENVLFQEITFKPRQGGKNSINMMKIVKIGTNALKDFYQFRKVMKEDRKNAQNKTSR